MSSSTSHDSAGEGSLPLHVPFHPGETAAPLDAADLGTVVLLLVGRADRRWAADTAVALCAEWARSGRRVVLADLHLENPVLHEAAGTDNLEGIVDVFLYGASIARSARPVRGQGFYLISAGTYDPDAEAIYSHPRWPKLVAGFRDAQASLVLFAPEQGVDMAAVSQWARDVVLLGEPVDPALATGLEESGVARAVLTDPAAAQAAPALPAEPDEPEPAVAQAAPPVPDEPTEPEPAGVELQDATEEFVVRPDHAAPVPPAEAPPTEPDDLHLPPAPVRDAPATGRRTAVILGVLLLVAVIAALGYWASRTRPDLVSGRGSQAVGVEPAEAAAPARSAPSRTGAPLPYTVQMVAYSSLGAAREQVAAQRAAVDQVPLFITPQEIEGVMYFKVQAGALPDTVAAKALREQLLAARAIDEQEPAGTYSLIQYTPLAFDLGEFATREEVSTVVDSLAAAEVPAYAVAVPYSDGSRRWQLYGGAYQDSASAEAMRERLSAAGVQPRLVARIGEPPAPPSPQP